MGPSGHFYSCMGLMISDTGFPRVVGLSTDPRDLGRHSCKEDEADHCGKSPMHVKIG